jgi:hypothetical protein
MTAGNHAMSGFLSEIYKAKQYLGLNDPNPTAWDTCQWYVLVCYESQLH